MNVSFTNEVESLDRSLEMAMTKFMTLIAGAALAGATAMPAFANDPFVSTQDGEDNTINSEAAIAGGAAAAATAVIVLNDDSSSSSSSSSNAGAVFSLGAN